MPKQLAFSLGWFCLSHQFIKTEGETGVLQNNIKRLLAYLQKFKVFITSVCDGAVDEYRQLIEDELVQIKFSEFDKSKTRLDYFLFKVVNIKLFKNLVKVVKLILTFSHVQVSIERGFSINKSIIETNMKEESIAAGKLIRGDMLAHSLSPDLFVITKLLITFCFSADRKCEEHFESVKNVIFNLVWHIFLFLKTFCYFYNPFVFKHTTWFSFWFIFCKSFFNIIK